MIHNWIRIDFDFHAVASFVLILAFFILCLTVCFSVPAAAKELESTLEHAPCLEYTLQLNKDRCILARMKFDTRGRDSTQIRVEKEWGGVSSDPLDFEDLRALTLNGVSLPLLESGHCSWRVDHPGEKTIVIEYTIPKRVKPPLDRGNDYRTKLDDHHLQLIGHLGLAYPALTEREPTDESSDTDLKDDSWRIALTMSGFEEQNWDVVSSFGAGAGPHQFQGELGKFLHSTILAGHIQQSIREVPNGRIAVAVLGANWSFDPEQLAEIVTKILLIEREFFNDHTDPWYLITLSPVTGKSLHSHSLGGTSLHNSFNLYCTENLSLNPASPQYLSTVRLIAHEYFHHWNGNKIPTASENPSTYWFSEGFTNYFARRMMLQGKFIDERGFVEDLNQTIRNWSSNPHRNSPNSLIQSDFWTNRNAQELPYQRGELIATILNEKIREESNGTKSLDDLMKDLFDTPFLSQTIENEDLFQRISKFIDAHTSEWLSDVVENGVDLSLPERLSSPDSERTISTIQSFDPGFDLDKSRSVMKIVGLVPDSAAAQAGLENEMKILRFDFHSESSSTTPPTATVIVEKEGKEWAAHYTPLGKPFRVELYQSAK